MLGWTQAELAARSGVSIRTIHSFENDTRTPIRNNLKAIYMAMAGAGIEFHWQSDAMPICRLKQPPLDLSICTHADYDRLYGQYSVMAEALNRSRQLDNGLVSDEPTRT